jgi:hypothetical protein
VIFGDVRAFADEGFLHSPGLLVRVEGFRPLLAGALQAAKLAVDSSQTAPEARDVGMGVDEFFPDALGIVQRAKGLGRLPLRTLRQADARVTVRQDDLRLGDSRVVWKELLANGTSLFTSKRLYSAALPLFTSKRLYSAAQGAYPGNRTVFSLPLPRKA